MNKTITLQGFSLLKTSFTKNRFVFLQIHSPPPLTICYIDFKLLIWEVLVVVLLRSIDRGLSIL